MIKKKKRTWKLVVSLIFMSIVLVVSVGGLSIISGANANENIESNETNLDVVEKNNIVVSDYITNNSGGGNNKEIVKIETVAEAIAAVNNYVNNNAYVVTSTGKMNVSGTINGILKEQTICDLSYHDYFEHEVGGRAYWEEGFRIGKFYNSTLEGLFNTFIAATDYKMEQLNRIYFIDNDVHFSQWLDTPNFSNGFNADPSVLNSRPIGKCSNAEKLKANGYMDRYFRWDITENSVKNAVVSKLINGYQFEFDLDIETGARDVYYRWVKWMPQNIISNSAPGAYHYVLTFDRYGNIVSFARNESIKMDISSAVTGKVQLNFAFKYSFKTKNNDYKISLDNAFTSVVKNEGYLN